MAQKREYLSKNQKIVLDYIEKAMDIIEEFYKSRYKES